MQTCMYGDCIRNCQFKSTDMFTPLIWDQYAKFNSCQFFQLYCRILSTIVGVESSCQHTLWKFLFGIYPMNSTRRSALVCMYYCNQCTCSCMLFIATFLWQKSDLFVDSKCSTLYIIALTMMYMYLYTYINNLLEYACNDIGCRNFTELSTE